VRAYTCACGEWCMARKVWCRVRMICGIWCGCACVCDVYVYVSVYVCMRMYVCMCICTVDVHVYVHVRVYVYVYVYPHVYVCMYVYVCMRVSIGGGSQSRSFSCVNPNDHNISALSALCPSVTPLQSQVTFHHAHKPINTMTNTYTYTYAYTYTCTHARPAGWLPERSASCTFYRCLSVCACR